MEDSEDVYYCFAGAAIASMLHVRYDKLKQNGDSKQLSHKIMILGKLSINNRQDKGHSLKYQGKGNE